MYNRAFDLYWTQYKPMTRKEELRTLVNFVHTLRPKRILEIGVGLGGTFKMWEAIIPEDGLLVGMDKVTECSWKKSSKEVHFIKGDSTKKAIINKVKVILGENKFDFIFIDGSHLKEIVKQDVENYKPMLKKQGVIAFHDIRAPDTKLYHDTTTVGEYYYELTKQYGSFEILDPDTWSGSDGIGVLII